MPKKGRSTQSLVNAYPSWSNTRNDEQSLGYQYMNNIGRLLDDLRKQNDRIGDNYYIGTSVVSDIDVYYQQRLAPEFTFTKQGNDETDLLFSFPTVSGQLSDGSFVAVDGVEKNNIEGFWYSPAPSRISLGATVTDDHLLASGLVISTPFQPLTTDGVLHIPNHLTVTIVGGTSFIGLEDHQQVRRGRVIIEGVTRAGQEVKEEILFIHDDNLNSMHEYQSIATSGIRVYGINNLEETSIRVESAGFNKLDYSVAYQLDHAVTREEIPLFWSTASGIETGQYTLDLGKYVVDDVLLRLDGFVDKEIILRQELQGISGARIVPVDMTVEPKSNHLWVVDADTLYVYDNALPYPDTSKLFGKDYGAFSVIEPSSYYAIPGEDIELNYVWKRPVAGMVKHRVSVLKPDGSQFSIEDGVEVTYHIDNTSWVFGEPRKRAIRSSDIFTLDQEGEYIYTLEVLYANDTTSVDKRIVSVIAKKALAQFSLSSLSISNTIVGVDVDSEYKLWVLDSANNKYEINKHYDLMIADFTKKILYFREGYTQVRIV